jgi:DNA recombination protein RmuC
MAGGAAYPDLSPQPGKISCMDGFAVAVLILGLLLGLLLGVLASMLISRSRKEADRAQTEFLLAQARGEAAQARSETAQARQEAAHFRANLAEVKTETADARAEAAAAQAEAAEASAAVARAVAERGAAVERAKEIASDRQAMIDQFKVLSSETLDRQSRAADAQAEARLKATEQLMAPVREGLERFDNRLTEVEKERVAMATDLRSHVRAVQETGEVLRRETATLVTALRKPQTRGTWGETQLRRTAEIAGMVERCDFDLQQTAQADDRRMRPDMRVNLAGGKYLFVDSKVPLTGFLDAQETDDDNVRAEHLAGYARNVRHHIDQLSAKQYWKAADTPEFVVLFLPSEAFFATALDLIPDLYDYAAARDVVLATPTTLIALLRAVAYGWRQAALAESAAEVFKLGRDLHEKLGLMGNRLDKLGRALRTSVNAYNETIATVEGTVLVRARKFRDLQVSERDLTGLSSVDDPVRQISAGELVENAVQVKPMVGRGSRRHGLGGMPEGNELVRPDPDLIDLMDADNEGVGPAEETASSS